MEISYCSRVCCMYAIKQAMLLSGAVPMADIAIYYMDIRAFGKGYEQFYQNSKAMGVEFIKGKVATIDPGENGSVTLHYEAQGKDGGVKAAKVCKNTEKIPGTKRSKYQWIWWCSP